MKSIKELIEEWKMGFHDDKEMVIRELEDAQEYHEMWEKRANEVYLVKDKEIEELKKRNSQILEGRGIKELGLEEDFISKADAKQAILMLCGEETAERLLKELGISEEVEA
mgnify:CR=1 FL=1